MRRLLTALLISLSVGCRQPTAETLIVKSRCLTDAECGPIARCDLLLQQCYRDAPDAPYQVLLQVYAQAENVPLVEEFQYGFKLEPNLELKVEVPESVLVATGVHGDGPGGVEAEVTFTPSQNTALPGKSIVVNARESDGADNVRARLTSGTSYAVRVQPLVQASTQLPPMRVDTYVAPDELDLRYGALIRFDGVLADESEDEVLRQGHRVRLEDAVTGAVLSSVMEVKTDGKFTLFAEPEAVQDTQRPFNLAISLPGFSAWRVKVSVAGAQLRSDAETRVEMPIVPPSVTLTGDVYAPSGGTAPYAELEFSSQFKFASSLNAAGGVDWCRWLKARNERNALSCSARGTTTAAADGSFSLTTLPGWYEIFVSPGSAAPGRILPATTQLVSFESMGVPYFSIETQVVGGAQNGYRIELPRAARYAGQIRAYDGRPMPNVTVIARSLAYKGELSDELARYNRTSSAITDRRGRFELAIDRGYFDLLVEPPADSGFAWSGSLNRILDYPAGSSSLDMVMEAPVYVSGKVQAQTTGSEEPLLLPGARIEAYALVSSLAGGQRAVRIGQATSDELGTFQLALPARIGEELCTREMVAFCNCGESAQPVRRTCSDQGTFNTCECPSPPATGN